MQYYYRCEIWANAEILQQKPAPLGSASISHHITIRPRLQLLIDVITHFSNSETRNLVWILKLKFPYRTQQVSGHYFAGTVPLPSWQPADEWWCQLDWTWTHQGSLVTGQRRCWETFHFISYNTTKLWRQAHDISTYLHRLMPSNSCCWK